MPISCKNNPQDYANFVAQVRTLRGDYHWLLTTMYTAINAKKPCRLTVEDPITGELIMDSEGILDDVILNPIPDSLDCSAELRFTPNNGKQQVVPIDYISINNVDENRNSGPGAFFRYYIWHKDQQGCVCLNVSDR